jgi:plastocyanin
VKRHRWSAIAISTIGAFAVLAAGCGGGDDDGGDDADPNCMPVPPGQAVIDQDNLKFSPDELCVAPGQEVLFRNSESAIHTVTIDGENLSGTMRKGDEFRWTPPGTGTYRISCDFHPQMKARITVPSAPGTG